MGSGNEREILMLMLDKSTYFEKATLFSLQSVFFMYKILSNQNLNLQNAQLNLKFWPLC